MKINEILIAGIAGTTAFTLFSYLVSKGTGNNYKEPELLGTMIDRAVIDSDHDKSEIAGWLSHYSVGIGFAAVYKQLINKSGMKPSIKNGIIIGALSGFPAALTWHTTLSAHPAPPRKKSMDYYLQLLLGHIIFGTASFFVFHLFKKAREKKGTSDASTALNSNESKLSPYATAGS